MDNLTHTLVGAALAESGLRRRTALGTATLLIGANFPDIDVVAVPLGRGLELRRGWTHGVLALAVLPVVLTALMLAWDRLARARRTARREAGEVPDAGAAARPAQILLLAALSIATHPMLDWLNTYGVRWLMPFDGRWFYGDALFIIDPWVWLALAAGVVLARRRRRAGAPDREWVRPARVALAAVGAYAAAMLALGAAGRRVVARDMVSLHPDPAGARLMVAPVPVNPLVRQVVYRHGDAYYLGTLTWRPAPRLTMRDTVPWVTPRDAADVAREVISVTRAGQVFFSWARLPFFVVEGAGSEAVVRVGDLRYTRDARDSWAAVAVRAADARAALGQPDTAGEPPYQLLEEITARTSEADLVRRFGAANVVRGDVGLGEGETAPGTILFPDDSARRLEIVWRDTAARTAPQLAQLSGQRSRWAIAPGVTLGTTLAELERMNGAPFTLTGFEWDYSGTVTSWRGGRLDGLPAGGRRLIVRLAPAPGAGSDADVAAVAGDREFPSDHPVMRRLNPRVYEMGVFFE